jgi:hypothetical protein
MPVPEFGFLGLNPGDSVVGRLPASRERLKLTRGRQITVPQTLAARADKVIE